PQDGDAREDDRGAEGEIFRKQALLHADQLKSFSKISGAAPRLGARPSLQSKHIPVPGPGPVTP
ncbi:hypothetical protein, partial [Ligaoa zhengdingensis]|uniref:hypothetical protein n=1 Tax=Ligaoa zhengdingensis TaxID=2763658 RepID=UPI0031B9F9CC